MITLQDSVTDLLDNGSDSRIKLPWSEVVWPLDPASGAESAERVYASSRQARIMDVEDRLLEEVAKTPFYKETVRLVADPWVVMTLHRDLTLAE